MVKINLGSGPRHVENWISFDNSPRILIRKFMRFRFFAYLLDRFSLASEQTWDFGIRYGNVRKLSFENNTVDFFYLSHVLEHLYLSDAEDLLRRLYGALKQGGKVRICSPDYEAFVEKLNKNLKKDPLLAAIEFHHDLLSHPLLRPSIKKKLLMRFTGHVHYWYPFSFLIESMLKSVGFKCITFHTFRSGTFPDLEKIENRDKASFYVEAVKL